MPFMDEPPGAKLSTGIAGAYGGAIRALRSITKSTLNKEPSWRRKGRELATGYQPRW
jgi:hydrogenase small subunit